MSLKSFVKRFCAGLLGVAMLLPVFPEMTVHAAAITYETLPPNYETIGNWVGPIVVANDSALPSGLQDGVEYLISRGSEEKTPPMIWATGRNYFYHNGTYECPDCHAVCHSRIDGGGYTVYATQAQEQTTPQALLMYQGVENNAPNGKASRQWRHDGCHYGEDKYTEYTVSYIQCRIKGYWVAYNANGGSGSMSTDLVRPNVNYTLKNSVFAKTGYTQDYWTSGSNTYSLRQTAQNWTSVGNTITMYAHWLANKYTISYNGNGATSGSTENSSATYDQNVYIRPSGFFKIGYTFSSWNTASNGGGTRFNGGTTTTSPPNLTAVNNGTATLYAQWTENHYAIRFDKNKPTRASSSVQGNMPDQTNLLWSGSYALNNNTFTLTGWTFKGWSLSPGDSNTVDYANAQTICNKTDGRLPDNPDGTVTVLYAVWKENKYNILFDGNNDTGYVTGSTSPIYNILYEDTVNLTPNGFARTSPVNMEYKDGIWRSVPSVFQGWNYDVSDGQHVVFTNGQSVVRLSATDGSNVLLHAVWDDNPTFNIGPYHDPEDGNPNQNFNVEFPDRYFTLEDAQNGVITRDALLSDITGYDREGTYTIELVGYNPSDYENLSNPATLTQTYKVTDNIGRYSYMTVNVYVLENDSVSSSVIDKFRSYDGFYYMRGDHYVPMDDGGLYQNSKWLKSNDQRQALEKIVMRMGDANNSVFTFNTSTIGHIRDYVLANGIGTNTSGNLAQAYLQYMQGNKKN